MGRGGRGGGARPSARGLRGHRAGGSCRTAPGGSSVGPPERCLEREDDDDGGGGGSSAERGAEVSGHRREFETRPGLVGFHMQMRVVSR